MKRKLLIFSLLTLFGLNGKMQTLDQSSAPPIGAGWLVDNGPYASLAQSFTAGVSSDLHSIEFYLEAGNTTYPLIAGTFSMEIRDGVGYNGTLLSTETFNITGSESTGMYSVLVSSSTVNLSAGNQYTFILRETSGTGRIMVATNNGLYASGTFYSQISTNPPSNYSNYDMIFNTYVAGCQIEYQSIDESSCTAYTVPSGDETYVGSGVYNDTLTTVNGCDSILTINFTRVSLSDPLLTAAQPNFCVSGSTSIDGTSEPGVSYTLRDNSNNNIIDGPKLGNGGQFSLNTGSITNTVDYNVYSEYVASPKYSLEFAGNGSNQYVDLGNPMNAEFTGRDSITVEAWVNTGFSNNLGSILGNYEGDMQFLLRLDNNRCVLWVDNGPGYQQCPGNTILSPNTWYHLAGTWDGVNMKVYVNGVLDNTVALNGAFPAVTNSVTLGRGLNNGTEYFDGKMTGVRIWKTARTQTQINTFMDSCIAGYEPGLVALYYMADGPGSFGIQDMTGNGYDGTLINMDPNNDYLTDLPNVSCTTCGQQLSDIETVTINQPTTGTDVQVACNSYQWIDGNTYSTSNNTATHTLTSAVGCDSVVTLNLTINQPTTGTDTQVACGSYTWIDGNTYSTSNNTATHTLTNAAGCDSVVTLNLTVNQATTGTDTQVACGSYAWIDGNTYTASNTTATHTLTNSVGCDSLVTLNLTINQPSTGTDVQSACDSYTWIDGNTYTASNNSATVTLTNAVGCDSVITLDLTITSIDTSIAESSPMLTANQAGASYQWLDCANGFSPISGETGQSYTATTGGEYAVEINSNGCSDTSSCYIVAINGLIDNDLIDASLYPNPTTGLMNIDLTKKLSTIQVVVYDVQGKTLIDNSYQNLNTINLNLEGPKGIYFVELRFENGTNKILKVIKE